ncbi:MAG: hypothetical protein JW863_02260 [Chitinispirillaceae bacterium]|nr:hypothetical protein [Chitinispirillaceae bacterium]
MDSFHKNTPAYLVATALFILVVILYLPALKFDFINFDDTTYITENPHVRSGISISGLRWAFTTGYSANYHPLTWLSHMIDCTLFGMRPGPHHLANILLHALNSVLLLFLLYRTTGHPYLSLAVATFFAFHPLRVESVVWVSERKDVLSAFFWLLTCHVYVEYVRRKERLSGHTLAYISMIVCFLCGLMAKPMLVTLPFALLLMDFWPLGRFSLSRKGCSALPKLLYEKLPLFGISIVWSLLTFLVQRHGGAVVSPDIHPLAMRAANGSITVLQYVKNTLLPSDLSFFYPYPEHINHVLLIISILVICTISTAALRYRNRLPFLLFGWFWFLGTLIPVIGIVQVGSQAMADRYTYIPHIGLFTAVVWTCSHFTASLPSGRKIAFSSSVTFIIALSLLSARQLTFWKNSRTLAMHALSICEQNAVAHHTLGISELSARNYSAAYRHFKRALQLRPAFEEAQVYSGITLAESGDLRGATGTFREVLSRNPENRFARINLGVVLYRCGKTELALKEFLRVKKMFPDDPEADRNIAIIQKKPAD